jgi:hypothetical protein
MKSPFTTHNPLGISTPLYGFQHRLDNKSTCWHLKNSTTANTNSPSSKMNTNSPSSKTCDSLANYEQHVTPRHTTSFSKNFQLQIASKLAHNNYLQASALKTPLLARKLHVKTSLYVKM